MALRPNEGGDAAGPRGFRALTSTFRRAVGSSMATGGAVLFVAMAVVNVLGFLVHVVASRDLSRSDYGAFATLLGVLLVLSVPASALQTSVTQRVAQVRSLSLAEHGRPMPVAIRPLLATAVIFGTVAFGVLLVAAPAFASFFHLGSVGPAVILAAWAVPAAIGLVPRAVLLGELRYWWVAAALLGGAIVRLVLTAVFANTTGISGALAAIVIGEVFASLVLLVGLRDLLTHADDVPALEVGVRDIVRPVFALTGFWIFTTVDTVLSRRLLSGSTSGLYAASAVAARAAMFLPSAVSLVAFPKFAESSGAGSTARTALFRALMVTAAITIPLVAVVLLLANRVIDVLFGSDYRAATGTLRILVMGFACLGAFNVLMYFVIASRRGFLAALSWFGCGAVVVLAVAIHPGPTGLALITSGVSMVMLVTLLSAVVFSRAPTEPGPDYGFDAELWRLPAAELDVSIVVPYFNPGRDFSHNVVALLDVLDGSNVTFEVIAVSDGSTDGSAEALREVVHPQLLHEALVRNQGKGAALRVGLRRGRGRYIGFIDADGDIDCRALTEFLRLIELYEPEVVLGSKRHPMSSVAYPPMRRVYSWVFQQLVRVLFRLNIRDSQTGIKLVRRDVLAAVLPRMVEKRFAFDLELFVVARHLGFKKFFEAPVSINHQFNSTISRRAVWGMLKDTLAILYRLRGIRYYDRSPADADARPQDLRDEGVRAAPRG